VLILESNSPHERHVREFGLWMTGFGTPRLGHAVPVHPRRDPTPDLLRLAREQSGVLTREQALGLGLGVSPLRRLVTTGQWRRLARGLYFTAAVTPPWIAWAWGGVLLGGDRARLGGRAAAHLLGLVDPPDVITVLVPADGSRPAVDGPWDFRRERPTARSWRTVGQPPRIGPEDTVLDLVADEVDLRAVIGLVTTSVQRRLTTPERLREAMSARRCVAHRAALVALLGDVSAGAQSPLEVTYLRDVERAHELPAGRRQVRRRGTVTDVYYEHYGLLVELDGRLGHAGMGRFRDMRRDNRATSDGLATLRYGSADVMGDPCAVAIEVAHNLALRGWSGCPVRCAHCRRVG
jgi:very-short-patch-repair endonuclease